MEAFKDIIAINDDSRVRKHRQIVDSVLSASRMGTLKFNEKLPSVNEWSINHNVSRDTVVRAYTFLKENNIIESIPGKGYYLKAAAEDRQIKVFLLLHNLELYQKNFFDALTSILNEFANIDFYVYQNDFNQFKKTISNSKFKEYTHYVLSINLNEIEEEAAVAFIKNEIPLEKLIVIDKKLEELGTIACVYQDYEEDIYLALCQLNVQLSKYGNIKLIFPRASHLPKGIKNGFLKFCVEYEYGFGIVEDAALERLERNTVYITIEDQDLIELVKQIKRDDVNLGEDIGLISYHDSSLKEILMDGITVVSSDFQSLGKEVGLMVLNDERKQLRNRLEVVLRKSL